MAGNSGTKKSGGVEGETKHTQQDRLLKKVRQMNSRSEKAREAMYEQAQEKIKGLEKEISRLTDQIASLPAHTEDENVKEYRNTLKQRRTRLHDQVEAARRMADPVSQFDEIREQLDKTQQEYEQERKSEEKKFHSTAKSVLRRKTMMTDGTVKHSTQWDKDIRPRDWIYRYQVGLGDDDPEKKKQRHLPWTKFDFKYGKGQRPFRLRFETGQLFEHKQPKKDFKMPERRKPFTADEVLLKTKRQPPSHYPHSKPWVLGDEKAFDTFSTYEPDKPRTVAEMQKAKTALIPDRVYYEPRKYGLPSWKDPEPSEGTGLFQRPENERDILKEKRERDQRQKWLNIGLDPDEAAPKPYIKERKNRLEPSSRIPEFPLYEESLKRVQSTSKERTTMGKQRGLKFETMDTSMATTGGKKGGDQGSSSSSIFTSSRDSRARKKKESKGPQRTALNTFGDALQTESL